MVCSCNSSRYKYESCGHVVTGDLGIIKDVKLRNLISKGPAYREQNSIDWRMNLKNCKAAVSRYAKKWAKEANVDRRVLRDWEETVYKFIDEKVASLKQREINKRKKHVLKSRVNLDNLNKLHDNFVLVPADKASNNVIVVCKKYYLDVVIKELSLNNTYKEVHSDCVNIISRHLDYMVRNEIEGQEQHEQVPSFYWLPKLHKKTYGSRFIAASNKSTEVQTLGVIRIQL